MHKSSILRMAWFVDHYASKLPGNEVTVLDVGSYDIRGSYRHLFADDKYQYTGLDIEAGPNVDIVLKNPYNWETVATDGFDVVISGQAFEHIEFFWLTMSEITRVLKKNGLLCLIAPSSGFGEHRHPVDCYRFFTDGMVALARFVSLEVLHAHTNCAPSIKDTDWYVETGGDAVLIARKPYSGNPQLVDLKAYRCVPENHEAIRDGFVPYTKKKGINRLWHKVKRRLFKLKRLYHN